MEKKFRRWLLRRRPVTEGVKRRNRDYGNFFKTSCKRSFKKIAKNVLFLSFAKKKPEKTELSVPLSSIRESTFLGNVVLRESFLQGKLAMSFSLQEEQPNDRSNPTILSVPSRIGGLRELPKFCKRFRLPTESFGAHHRETEGREKQTGV